MPLSNAVTLDVPVTFAVVALSTLALAGDWATNPRYQTAEPPPPPPFVQEGWAGGGRGLQQAPGGWG